MDNLLIMIIPQSMLLDKKMNNLKSIFTAFLI